MPLLETRGAASAKAFGFTAASAGIDWTKYILIPYSNGTTQTDATRMAFYNVSTLTIDFDIPFAPTTSQNCSVIRVGDWLYWWSVADGTNAVRGRNIITGTAIANQNLSSGLGNGDIIKIGNNGSAANPNKIIVSGRSGTSMYVAWWNHDNATGLFSNTAGTAVSGMFTSSSTPPQSYSSPQIAPVGIMDSTTGAYTYGGAFAFCCVNDYPAPYTETTFAAISAPYSGSTPSLLTYFITSNNFSRPKAALVPQSPGYAYAATFDGNPAYLFDNAGNYGPTGSLYTGGMGHGWGPCGLVGGSGSARSLNSTIDYSFSPNVALAVYRLTNTTATFLDATIIDPYTSFPPAVQQTGYNSTYAAFLTRTYQLSGTNYAQWAYMNSAGSYTYANLIPALQDKLINGFNRVTRIVNYGA